MFTVNFNRGTLIPAAASTAYMSGLVGAFVKSGGAKISVPTGGDITIAQSLLADTVSTRGGLTKLNTGSLILTGASTYTGPSSHFQWNVATRQCH